ncbi:hypothetical protein E0L21_13505 [Kosakonia quasisacchari]|uniref:Uncharacterized protein n=1 Tax=Kosakonia quasisacchari TaxID=2529380 RepID=A0A4R0H811_9ENTR|nr:hypothetical protein E0L21_13505 [Kosakonia quasisacchari]
MRRLSAQPGNVLNKRRRSFCANKKAATFPQRLFVFMTRYERVFCAASG